MRRKSVPEKEPVTQVVKNIRRATRRHFSAEDKIRIVLEGLRGEDSIAKLCRHEGIVQNLITAGRKTFSRRGRPQGLGPSRPQGRDPPNSPRVEASLVASARLLTRRMGLRHRSV
jgi:transposase